MIPSGTVAQAVEQGVFEIQGTNKKKKLRLFVPLRVIPTEHKQSDGMGNRISPGVFGVPLSHESPGQAPVCAQPRAWVALLFCLSVWPQPPTWVVFALLEKFYVVVLELGLERIGC